MPARQCVGASEEFRVDVDLVRLRYFATVADHLHFGRAAAALHISRPALSRTVTELEAELGVELFVRPSEHTELTADGEALLARARTLLAEDAARDDPDLSPADGSAPAFTVAIMPGVTISKWTKLWAERMPDRPLRVLRTDADTQTTVLRDGLADVSFVRLPIDKTGLSTIPLYAEMPVVVVPKDHEIASLESISVLDLVDEHLLQDPDDVPQWRDAARRGRTAPRRPLPEMASTADAIALVAAGLGIVIVPQSVARMNHRKDVTYRPVRGVDEYPVAMAWSADDTSAEVEVFIGIVRGRSAHSSRSANPAQQPAAAARRGDQPRQGEQPRRGDQAAAPSSARRKSKVQPKARRPRGTR
ncbi:LysR family transcriptional regulator [Pengzhenrongella sicca]|uniref:LysR family transcriptional regulator n=1 Tax=Pengzhenrongella sicca TaxID=2819238 RepID=A0A8A4ZBM3_9MICO|nr:LysR family transcriptional regulator [Pengzhenrongella sicca]QTE27887.1 LysR family transcriptional regulator [Pengzhenrongella sicca]